ncbi:MAG: hypothetical protein K0Q94_4194 [Paenibacillus sp.]|jgi:AraC-like DNA-binding protein|nr:hypothetical protein [Paenibacillus sp.]
MGKGKAAAESRAVSGDAAVESWARVERTVTYMNDHYGEEITRDRLASIAGVDPSHYSRMFKKYKNISPTDYLTRVRIEQAKTLLRKPELSIARIAKLVGYGDPYHFSRRFKQWVGVAPAYYRPAIAIAALDGYGHCKALGITPVALNSADSGTCLPDADESSIDLHLYCDTDERLAEQLKVIRPDFIISMDSRRVPELSLISPVVHINVLEDPIYGQLRNMAEALGKRTEAEAWISNYERRRLQLRKHVSDAIGTPKVAIMRVREKFIQIYGMQNMGYPLYHSLDLAPPDKIAVLHECNVHFHSSVIGMEELSFYPADHLFVVVQPDEGSQRRWDQIAASPAYRSYPAVAAGKVYMVDVTRWLAYDPISISCQMEEAAMLLTGDSPAHKYPSVVQSASMVQACKFQ